MKTIKLSTLFFLIILINVNLNAQISIPNENQQEQQQTQILSDSIVGTWGMENNELGYQQTYYSDGTMINHIEGQSASYYWAIYTTTTTTGLYINYLILQNQHDSEDRREFSISAITQTLMTLEYQGGMNYPMYTFIRQNKLQKAD